MGIDKIAIKEVSKKFLRMYPVLLMLNSLPLLYIYIYFLVTKGRFTYGSFQMSSYNLFGSTGNALITITFLNIYLVMYIFIVLQFFKNQSENERYTKSKIILDFVESFKSIFLSLALVSFHILFYFSIFTIIFGAINMVIAPVLGQSKALTFIKYIPILYFSVGVIFTFFIVYIEKMDVIAAFNRSKYLVLNNFKKIFLTFLALYIVFYSIDYLAFRFIILKVFGGDNVMHGVLYMKYLFFLPIRLTFKITIICIVVFKLYENSIEYSKKGKENLEKSSDTDNMENIENKKGLGNEQNVK